MSQSKSSDDLLARLTCIRTDSKRSIESLDQDFTLLVHEIRSAKPQVLAALVFSSPDPLEVVNPADNSIAYLFILLTRLQSSTASSKLSADNTDSQSNLWTKTQTFLVSFDALQISYALNEFRQLLEAILSGCLQVIEASSAATAVQVALLRLDPTTSCFSSLHAALARFCLRQRTFSAVVPILDNDIFFFPEFSEDTAIQSMHRQAFMTSSNRSLSLSVIPGYSKRITHRESLEYFLHGAMVYMAVKDWQRALHFLELVITAPTMKCVSMIMIEAYKKWNLAVLLTNPPERRMPVTNPIALKAYKTLARPYEELVTAFRSGNLKKLSEQIVNGKSTWEKDFNAGLVAQVFQAFRVFSMTRIGQTYAALPLAQVARLCPQVGSDASTVRSYLEPLIANGQVKAELVPPSGQNHTEVLRFTELHSTTSEIHIQTELATQRSALTKTLQLMHATSRKLELASEHVEHTRKQKTADSKAPATAQHGFDVDEDMMSDL